MTDLSTVAPSNSQASSGNTFEKRLTGLLLTKLPSKDRYIQQGGDWDVVVSHGATKRLFDCKTGKTESLAHHINTVCKRYSRQMLPVGMVEPETVESVVLVTSYLSEADSKKLQPINDDYLQLFPFWKVCSVKSQIQNAWVGAENMLSEMRSELKEEFLMKIVVIYVGAAEEPEKAFIAEVCADKHPNAQLGPAADQGGILLSAVVDDLHLTGKWKGTCKDAKESLKLKYYSLIQPMLFYHKMNTILASEDLKESKALASLVKSLVTLGIDLKEFDLAATTTTAVTMKPSGSKPRKPVDKNSVEQDEAEADESEESESKSKKAKHHSKKRKAPDTEGEEDKAAQSSNESEESEHKSKKAKHNVPKAIPAKK